MGQKIDTQDWTQLRSFIISKALTCVHEPVGILRYKFVTPTYEVCAGSDDDAPISERSSVGHYLQMYDWDACFFSQAEALFGESGLAQQFVSNFLSLKQVNGYVPRTISPKRIWDGSDLSKPFLAQALLHEMRLTGESQPVGELIADLDCYLKYFERSRKHKSGLFHWRNALESGVDNNLALLAPKEAEKDENKDMADYPDGILLASDLNAYMVAEFRAFSEICLGSGEARMAQEYAQKAKQLCGLIEKYLWNETIGIYCNFDPRRSSQVLTKSWTCFAPVLFDCADRERCQRVIESIILNPKHFLRPYGLSSLASSELLYNQSKRGLYGRAIVSNWQGPVWVLPNALTVRSLIGYGYTKEAVDLSNRVLSALMNALKQTGTLYENYDAETGQPLWAPQFMSWNVLALELLKVIEE